MDNLKKVKCGNKRNFYMNFQLKYGFGVEFTAYKGEMIKGALTSYISVLRLTRNDSVIYVTS